MQLLLEKFLNSPNPSLFTREVREGWPMTVETEANGDSWSTNGRGLSLARFVDLYIFLFIEACRPTGFMLFCPALAALVRPVQNIFFPPHTSFTSFVPIAQRAGQAVVPGLSLNMCLSGLNTYWKKLKHSNSWIFAEPFLLKAEKLNSGQKIAELPELRNIEQRIKNRLTSVEWQLNSLRISHVNQCCGAFLTPGSGIRNRFFSWSRIRNHIYESLVTIFLGKNFQNSLKLGQNFFLSISNTK